MLGIVFRPQFLLSSCYAVKFVDSVFFFFLCQRPDKNWNLILQTCFLFGQLITGSFFSGVSGRTFMKAFNLPVEINSDTLDPVSCQHQLKRSKTEKQRHESILAADAAQIFDNEISIDQKVFESIQFR